MHGELILKPGKERSLLRRHPWVYDTAVARVQGKPARGDTVAVMSAQGQWLAWAAFAPESTLRARCWSFDTAASVDAAWMQARVADAVARRLPLAAHTDAVRLVFGEADQLPGFVVDRYAGQLVLQLQSSGAEAWREVLVDGLVQATGCANVFERSDSATRKREGLAPAAGVLRGAEPAERIRVHEHGLAMWVDVRRGHKTGYYVDQRDNRRLLQQLTREASVRLRRPVQALNCFCYTGGFSLAAAAGGASAVLSIDSSAEALALAAENAALNAQGSGSAGADRDGVKAGGVRGGGDLAGVHTWQQSDVFEALRELREAGRQFDLIVLDPPKFASTHHHIDRAARAYKDITLNALRILAPGGDLLTFSCSGAISGELFQKIVAGAVIDARVDCQMLQRLAAGSDHPLLMTHPEGEYLKGFHLRRL
jgi:23S rRNA (cytosine1962-C5)-methyltransferase